MTIPVLKSNWDFAAPGIEQLGGAISHLINPNREIQEQLKLLMAKDPTLRQKLIDMEAANPGSLIQQFGKQAGVLGKGNISPEMEMQLAQRGMANQQLGDLQANNSVAAQAKLKALNLETAPEAKATEQKYSYYGKQIEQLDQALSMHKAKIQAAGGEKNLANAEVAPLLDNVRKIEQNKKDLIIADEVMKANNGNMGEVLNNIVLDTLHPAEAKKRGVKPITWEQQAALINTNPQAGEMLQQVFRSALEQQSVRDRYALSNYERANQDELLAKSMALDYMKTAGQYGGMGADPVVMKKVFQMGLGKALESKDPAVKAQAEIVNKIEEAKGGQYIGLLQARAGQARAKLMEFAAKVTKPGKYSMPSEAEAAMLRAAVDDYNQANSNLEDYSNITGKQIPLVTGDFKMLEGGWLSKDKPILSFKKSVTGGNDTINYDAEAQAYKASGGTIAGIDSLPITPEQKSKMKLAFGKLK